MAMMNVPELGDDAQAAFREYEKHRAACARLRASEAKAKTAKTAVVELMGESKLAKLPDGRVIQRVARSRAMPPLPAKTQEWEDLEVLEL